MSRYIATRAIRGANAIVAEAQAMLARAIEEKGPDTPVAFPNTAYYLPVSTPRSCSIPCPMEGLGPPI